MKTFFTQLFIVSGIITLICLFGGLIDRLPFLGAILFGVIVAGVFWYAKPKRNHVSNGL